MSTRKLLGRTVPRPRQLLGGLTEEGSDEGAGPDSTMGGRKPHLPVDPLTGGAFLVNSRRTLLTLGAQAEDKRCERKEEGRGGLVGPFLLEDMSNPVKILGLLRCEGISLPEHICILTWLWNMITWRSG